MVGLRLLSWVFPVLHSEITAGHREHVHRLEQTENL